MVLLFGFCGGVTGEVSVVHLIPDRDLVTGFENMAGVAGGVPRGIRDPGAVPCHVPAHDPVKT